MLKKIICLLLGTVMLTGIFTACSNKERAPSSETETDDQHLSEEYPEIDAYVNDLARGRSFGGADFNVIGAEMVILPETEEDTGNLENDALYKRSREIEEKFGVDFSLRAANGVGYYDLESEINDLVYRDVMSGANSYDLIEGSIKLCGTVMLRSNSILCVDDMDAIDLSRSWWIDGLREQYAIRDKLYFLTGKLNLSHYNDPSCVLYNMRVAESYNLPDLYEIVASGEWTLDKMYEVASVIPAGASVRRYMIDYEYGLSLFFGAGFSLYEFDENGDPAVMALSEEMIDYIEKIKSGFADDTVSYNGLRAYFLGAEDYYDRDTFDGDRSLFWVDCLWRAADMRPYDVEFGILPVPKKDVSQTSYIAYSNSSNGVYFEKTAQDTEMAAVITEAMAALSEKYIEPAFYEKSLKGRSTYDEESRAVLDILYNARTVDLVATYKWANIPEMLNKACSGVTEGYVSSYNSSIRVAKTQIAQLLRIVEKYE